MESNIERITELEWQLEQAIEEKELAEKELKLMQDITLTFNNICKNYIALSDKNSAIARTLAKLILTYRDKIERMVKKDE